MAIGSFVPVNDAIEAIAKATIDLDGDTFYAMLCDADLVGAPTLSTYANVSGEQVSGGGYARIALTSVTVIESGGTVTFDCADFNFGAAVTITAKWLVVLKGTAASPNASDPILGYIDLNTDSSVATVISTNGLFLVRVNASGLFRIRRAS